MTSSPPEPPPTFVIGHRNPDTDAICAAVGYAEFLRQTGTTGAVAACCGEINDRTAWALRQAGVRPPRLVMDVRPTAVSICRQNVVKAREDETFLEVYQRMAAAEIRSVPVVDTQGRVVGMPTVLELLALLLPAGDLQREARRVRTSLRSIVRSVEGLAANEPPDADAEVDLVMVVGASSIGTVSARMKRFPAEQLVVLCGDRPRVHQAAIDYGVRALVLTGGFELDPALAEKAAERRVCVIGCLHDTVTAAQLIRCSRRVAAALAPEPSFLSFGTRAPVKEIIARVHHSNQPLFPVVEEETGRLVGVFSKSDLVDPPRARLVLVDHNEFSQAVLGAEDADIVEVVDHHRLSGNLATREPVRFINEPVGSTSTIVGRSFRDRGLEPPPAIALCLAAGIISDTLKLTSPTTAALDREILPWLAGIADIELDEFTAAFFAEGSILRSRGPDDAIRADRKEFHEHGRLISISQIEELGLDEFWNQEDRLLAALRSLLAERSADFACVMVTDITRHTSILLTAGAPEIETEIEYPELRPHVHELQGVVSRKKQLFPYLSRILARMPAAAPAAP